MYGERLQRRVVFRTNQQSSQAMSRRIHGLEARVSKMESKLCALCLELKQVQQILITDTNKFSPYMPNVSHHVEVEAEEHQSLEDPLAEMVKILVPSCAHLSPNSLVDLMVRPGLQEQVPAIHKPLQSFVVQTVVKSLKAPSHKKHVLFGELIPNTLARKGISNVAPSRLAVAVAMADGQQLAVEIKSLEQDKHTQVVEWQAGKQVITQMLPEYDTQILTQID
jgi:hypothetical protein